MSDLPPVRFGVPEARDVPLQVEFFGLGLPYPNGLTWLFLICLFLLGAITNKRNLVVTTTIAIIMSAVFASLFRSLVLTEVSGFGAAFDNAGVMRPLEHLDHYAIAIPLTFVGGILAATVLKKLMDGRKNRTTQ